MTSQQNSPTRRVGRRWLFALGALAGALVAAVPVAWASHQFTDVPDSNPFHTEISNLAGSGITAGKTCAPPGTPPTFCPDEPVVRQSMAAFLNRGLSRGTRTAGSAVPVGDNLTQVGSITLNVGGVPGGTQFVKIDASIGTWITSTTGCPCSSRFAIYLADGTTSISGSHFIMNTDVNAAAGNFGDESGALTTVVAVPTGTTQTFRVMAERIESAPASGAVFGFSSMTASTLAFGSTGSSTLGAGPVATGRPSQP